MTTAKPIGSYVGPYQLLRELGAGGMGRVYLARSPGGREVAVKLLRDELAGSAAYRQRFAAEAAAARSVVGVFTAPVVDADPFGPEPWLATAFVPGPTLEQAVRDGGPLAEGALRELAAGLAEALAAIHAAGLAHRDLKPSNVLMSAEGPRVIDFGISTSLDIPGEQDAADAVSVGTPGFSAPEQAAGQQADARADVFALGAVLVYAATGHSPFGQGPPVALRYRAAFEEPDLTDVPTSMRAAIAACLDKDPRRRPNPAQVLTALAPTGWAPTVPMLATPPTAPLTAPTTPPTAPATTLPATSFATQLLPPPGTTVLVPGSAGSTPQRAGMSRRRLLYLSGGIVAGVAGVSGATVLVMDLLGGKGSGGGSGTPTGSPTATPVSLGTFSENSASLPKAPKPLWTIKPPATTGSALTTSRISVVDDVVLWYPVVVSTDFTSSSQDPLIAYDAATGKQAWSAVGKIPTRGTEQRVRWVGVNDSLIYGYLTAYRSDYSQVTSILALDSHGKLVVHQDLSDETENIDTFYYVSADVVLFSEVSLQAESTVLRLTAFSVKNGRRLWDTSVEISALPGVVADGSRCFVFSDGTVTAYDLHSGKRLWQQNPELGSTCVLWPGENALMVCTQQVMSYVGGAGAGTVAYDPATGNRLWSTASAVVLAVAGTAVYTSGTAASEFSALDQKTGHARWTFQSPAMSMNAAAGNNPQANDLASSSTVSVPLVDMTASYGDGKVTIGPGILVLDGMSGKARWAYAGPSASGATQGTSVSNFTGAYTLTVSDNAVFATAGSTLSAFPTGG